MATPSWLHLFLDVPTGSWSDALTFWASALSCTVSPPRGEDGQFVTLLPASGEPWLKLQRVDAEARTHLDLDSTNRPGFLRSALSAGAMPAWRYHDVDVVRSPGGLLVCCTVGSGGRLARVGDVVADQVAIDVPALWWDAELEFWASLTGREPVPGERPEFVFLLADGAPRMLLHRLGEASGAVRAHLDIAVSDRDAVTRRHVLLGAGVVATHRHWTVLTAPGGHDYCLTDRDPATGE